MVTHSVEINFAFNIISTFIQWRFELMGCRWDHTCMDTYTYNTNIENKFWLSLFSPHVLHSLMSPQSFILNAFAPIVSILWMIFFTLFCFICPFKWECGYSGFSVATNVAREEIQLDTTGLK